MTESNKQRLAERLLTKIVNGYGLKPEVEVFWEQIKFAVEETIECSFELSEAPLLARIEQLKKERDLFRAEALAARKCIDPVKDVTAAEMPVEKALHLDSIWMSARQATDEAGLK